MDFGILLGLIGIVATIVIFVYSNKKGNSTTSKINEIDRKIDEEIETLRQNLNETREIKKIEVQRLEIEHQRLNIETQLLEEIKKNERIEKIISRNGDLESSTHQIPLFKIHST